MHRLAMRLTVVLLGLGALSALGGCTSTPAVYQTMLPMGNATRSYAIAEQDTGMKLPGSAMKRFEVLLAKDLLERGGPVPVAAGATPDLVIHYSSLAYDNGSSAGRVATGAVSLVAPIDQVTDAGSGDVALLLQFRTSDGKPIGQIVVNSRVRGAFGSSDASLEDVTSAAAKFIAMHFPNPDLQKQK